MQNGASDRLSSGEVKDFAEAMRLYAQQARQELEGLDEECNALAKEMIERSKNALLLQGREGDRAHLLRALQESDGMEEIAKAFEADDYSGLAI